ncbi:MAG: guanylate kinase [Clostridium sp.]
MGKIFCLMGKSSSGKDTVFRKIRKDKTLELYPVVTYTTRPIRINEINGVEYFFIEEDALNKYRQDEKVIEERVYHTNKGDWYYATIDDGQINLKKSYILITTLEAYMSLRKFYGEENVVPFYIDLDDGIRLQRALYRERKQKHPNYSEMCRRFLADDEDFSTQNKDKAGINKYYINNSLNICTRQIINDIRSFMD